MKHRTDNNLHYLVHNLTLETLITYKSNEVQQYNESKQFFVYEVSTISIAEHLGCYK